MVELSGMGPSGKVPPIPVPAGGTQTKCSDCHQWEKENQSPPKERSFHTTPRPQGPLRICWGGGRGRADASTENRKSSRAPGRGEQQRWGGPGLEEGQGHSRRRICRDKGLEGEVQAQREVGKIQVEDGRKLC